MLQNIQNSEDQKEFQAIKKLYPDYTPEEQAEAADTLGRYLNLVWHIYNRMKRENPEKLTKILLNARFKTSPPLSKKPFD